MGNCSSFCQQCKAKTAGKNYLTEELKVPSEHFSKYVLNIDLNNEEESKHIDNMLNAILPGKSHLILSNTSICRQVNMKLQISRDSKLYRASLNTWSFAPFWLIDFLNLFHYFILKGQSSIMKSKLSQLISKASAMSQIKLLKRC